MAMDVTTLSIKVESKGINDATKALDALGSQAERTESAISRLSGKMTTTSASIGAIKAALQQLRSEFANAFPVGSFAAVNASLKELAKTVDTLKNAIPKGSMNINFKDMGRDAEVARKGVASLNQSLMEGHNVFQVVGKSFYQLRNLLGGAMLAAALVDIGKAAITAADGWTLAHSKLQIFLGSASVAADAQENLYKTAQKLSVPMEGMTTLFTRLVPAMGEYGYNTKSAMEVTTGMAAALKISGATTAETNSVLLQFSQAMGAGVLRGAEFNAVAAGAPIILRILSQELGKSQGALKKMASEGMLSTITVTEALKKHWSELAEKAADMPLTVGQAFTLLGDSFSRFAGKMNEATGITTKLAQAIKFIGDNLNIIVGVIAGAAAGFITYNVAMGVTATTTAAAAVTTSAYTGAQIAATGATLATAEATGVLRGALTLLMAHPIILALTALVAVVVGLAVAFGGAKTEAEKAGEAFDEAIKRGDVAGAMRIQQAEVERTKVAYTILASEIGRISQEQEKAKALGFSNPSAKEQMDALIKKVKELGTAYGEAQKKLEALQEQQSVEKIKVNTAAIDAEIAILDEEFRLKRKMTEAEKDQFKLRQDIANRTNMSANEQIAASTQLLKLDEKITKEARNKALLDAMKKSARTEESLEKKYTNQLNSVQAFISAQEEELELRRKLTSGEKEALKIQSFMDANKAKGSAVKELETLKETVKVNSALIDLKKEASKIEQAELAAKTQQFERTQQYNASLFESNRAIAEKIELQKLANRDVSQTALGTQLLALQADRDKIEFLKQQIVANEALIDGEIRLASIRAAARGDKAGMQAADKEAEAATKRIQGLQDQIRLLNKAGEASKALVDQMLIASKIELFKMGRTPGQILADGFGEAGSAIGKMMDSYEEFGKTSAAINKNLADQIAAIKVVGGKDQEDQIVKAEKQAADKRLQITAQMFGSMAGQAKGFFNEHSKGYAIMERAEKGFRAIELALALKNFVQKMFFTQSEVTAKVTGEEVKGDAVIAAGAKQVATNEIVGLSSAKTAVTSSFIGIPPYNFITGAAMIAIMAGLGWAISGGGGGAPQKSATEQRQEGQGTGTVFGDTSAKSESASKALETVANNSSISLKYNEGMLNALKSIESSITGVAKIVLRQDVQAQVKFVPGMFDKNTNFDLGGLLFHVKKSVVDSGIVQFSQSMKDIIDGAMLNVTGYAEVETKRKKWGKTTTSSEMELQNLDDTVAKQLTEVVKNMGNSIKESAKALGMDGQAFTDRLNNFVVDIGAISLHDLSAEDLQKTLTNVFSKLGDQMATAALATLEEFQKVGEGYFETLTRVASTVATVDGIFHQIGQTFSTTGLEAVKAKMKLVDLAGGLEELSSLVGNFYDKFYSESEKNKQTVNLLTEEFKALGLSMIDINAKDARIQFRDLVNKYKDTDSAVYIALLRMADQFASVTTELTDVAVAADKAQIALGKVVEALTTSAQGAYEGLQRSVDARKTQLKLDLDAQIKSLNKLKTDENERYSSAKKALESFTKDEKDIENERYSSAKKALENQKEAESKFYEDQQQALSDQLDIVKTLKDNLKSLFDSIVSTIKKLTDEALSTQSYQVAKTALDTILEKAKTSGTLPEASSFKDITDTLGNISSSSFSSAFDFKKEQLVTAGKLSQLGDIVGKQLDSATATIAAIESSIALSKELGKQADLNAKAQLDTLQSQHDSLIDTLDKSLQTELSQLEIEHNGTIKSLEDQLDIAQKKYDSDVAYLDSILTNAKKQLDIAMGTYQAILSVEASLSNFQSNVNTLIQNNLDYKQQQLEAMQSTSASEHGGINIIDQNQLDLISQIASMKEELAVANRTIAANTATSAKYFERWDRDGMPETRAV